MNFSFKNRIALYYMLATASIMALVFFIIYFVLQTVVYRVLDSGLSFEAHKHTEEIFIRQDSIFFKNKNEWNEHEHSEVEVNPVFIQMVNQKGELMDKSPNLKENYLEYHSGMGFNAQFDAILNHKAIRQIQVSIEKNGEPKGYILAAMSLEGTLVVLENLRKTLYLLYPIVLIALFFITRFLAGKSILPVKRITETTDRITRNSLNERVPLPENKDELFTLTSSINELLNRMQDAIVREKQFTADASHQLRTPLAVIKGTLEVLVRKSRTEEEYREKIGQTIGEIDRISEVVNQLLVLARFDKSQQKITKKRLDLNASIDDVLKRYKKQLIEKEIHVDLKTCEEMEVVSDAYYVDLILDNIISNAIKYSHQNTSLEITALKQGDRLLCRIKDHGIGIRPYDLENIFNPFFRSEALSHREISGNGLGLSIVKKSADLLNVKVEVTSELGHGTVFTLSFPGRTQPAFNKRAIPTNS